MNPLHQVLQHWFNVLCIHRIERIEGGLSGADVYRVTTFTGESYALKRFPLGVTQDQIAEIHRVMNSTRDAGCHIVPEPKTLLASQKTQCSQKKQSELVTQRSVLIFKSRVWELVQWVPGTPASDLVDMQGADRSLELVRLGAQAIAKFHRASLPMGTSNEVPPCVVARRQRLEELNTLVGRLGAAESGHLTSFRLREVLAQVVDRIDKQWRHRYSVDFRELIEFEKWPTKSQFVLRDVHNGHILFRADSGSGHELVVSGIIDFDAVRYDSPATDLSRWVLSFASECTCDHKLWLSALAGYRLELAFNEQQEVLARRLASISAWINLTNWGVWLLLERKRFACAETAIADRIERLLKAVDCFDRLSFDTGPTK